jgi:D-glycero-alpha-D-manno-heptose-7-phosphate kinase
MADIPAGTGLGSSDSFTTALLKALHTQLKNLVHPRELAEQACTVEIDILKEPIGKQDQYVSAFGGLTCVRSLLARRTGGGLAAQDQPANTL